MNTENKIEELDGVRREIRVHVGEDDTRKAFREATRGLGRRVRLPGFRPGKAPPDLVRARFADTLRQEVLEKLVPRSLGEALADAGIDPVHVGEVKDVEMQEDGPLVFTAYFEVAPDIELGTIRGLRITRPSSEPTDEEVAERIEMLRHEHAVLEPADHETPEGGDFVQCDFIQAPLEEGAEPRVEEDVHLRVGDKRQFDDLNQALLSGRVGETVSFDQAYPEAHPDSALAGKTVPCKIRLKSIRRRILPDLDDDFAAQMGKAESLEALRERFRGELAEAKAKWAAHRVREAVLDKLLEHHDFPAPPALVRERANEVMRERIEQILHRGMDPRMMKVDWEGEYKVGLGMAIRQIRAHFLLAKVAEAEGIETTEDEIQQRLAEIAEARKEPVARVEADLKKAGALNALRESILRRKILDFLLDDATILDEED